MPLEPFARPDSTRPSIYALGSINADFQVRVEQPAGSAETLAAHDFARFSGGKAANVALIARRLGHPVTLLGCVGNDELAQQALAPLRAAGVSLDGVNCVADASTAMSMIAVPPSGHQQVLTAPNANDRWSPAAVRRASQLLRNAAPGSVLVANCQIPGPIVVKLLAVAIGRGLHTVLDPSYPDRVDRATLSAWTVITPGEEEARSLTGTSDLDTDAAGTALRRLREHGVNAVGLRLAQGGCLLGTDLGLVHLPAPAVAVVDSTGAGDAFAAAFAVALLEGRDLEECAVWGVAAASLAVTAYGSQGAYLDSAAERERLEALLPQVRDGRRKLW